MSKKSPFGSVTFCEHWQLKGWKPHFQPTVAKSSISTHCNSMANGKKHVPIFRNKPWRPQLRDQTYASLHETQIQNLGQRDGIFGKHNASINAEFFSLKLNRFRQYTWMLQRQDSGLSVCFFKEWREWIKQTCPTNLLSAAHQILPTSAAERLAAPLPTHCC